MSNRLVLIVKPTHRCNMNCTYCYDRSKRLIHSENMTLEGAEQILKTFVGKYEELIWTWHGGEPLLMSAKDFYIPFYEKILPKYLNKGTKIEFNMQSNISLISDEHMAWINKYNVSVGTSHDGILDRQTRVDNQNWEKCAKYFMEHRASEYNGLGIGVTVTKDNCETLIESYKYLKEYTPYVFFCPVFGYQTSMENTKKIVKNLEDLLYYLLTETDDEILRPFDRAINYFFGEHGTICEDSGCLGRWYGIGPTLDVFPCGRNWSDEYKLGNLWQDDAIALQKSSAFNYLKNVNKLLLPRCMDCTLFDMCNCGCYNTRYLQAGSMEIHDETECYYKQELHRMCAQAIYANFDKITNKHFLNRYGERIKKQLANKGRE